MYNLPYFKEKDLQAVMEFIRNHPFAFIVGCDEACRPVATQIPVFIEEKDGEFFLTGHMMRNTSHHKAFLKNPAVLCVFTGPHTYVSATWYSNPHQASTWNYMSVHLRGELSFLGEKELIGILQKTSLHFEKGNTASTTVYNNLPDDYRKPLLKAIVAFEIKVKEMDNVFKLSQNHNEETYQNIIEKLSGQGANADAIATEMQKRRKDLFPS